MYFVPFFAIVHLLSKYATYLCNIMVPKDTKKEGVLTFFKAEES